MSAPPSRSSTFAIVGWIWRKSDLSACRDSSAMAPASSTPVGPPPTTTNVSSAPCSAGSLSCSARSNAMSTRYRISSAFGERLQRRRVPPVLGMSISTTTPSRPRESGNRRRPRGHSRDARPARRHRFQTTSAISTSVFLCRRNSERSGNADVLPVERRRGDLVQERLEDVVVAAIDQRDASWCMLERSRGLEPTESAADNDHVWPVRARDRHCSLHYPGDRCAGSRPAGCTGTGRSGAGGIGRTTGSGPDTSNACSWCEMRSGPVPRVSE